MQDLQPEPGKRIGHFRIVERLGQGGMGTVYKAVDLQLDRPVALKFLLPDLVRDAAAISRFQREARLASQLLHPNIAAIFEFAVADEGHFIAMEFVEGQTVRQQMQGKPLGESDLRQLAAGVAGGLAEAHRKKILHRDIKPGNVVFTESGIVKILDFGLAKIVEPAAEPQESLEDRLTEVATASGQLMGTYGYIPPEVLRGMQYLPASDVFSLGILLYEAATGGNPFSAATPALVISNILNHHPAPPSTINHLLDRKWDAIILRCLEKDPDRRFADAAELQKHLESGHEHRQPQASLEAPVPVAGFLRRRWISLSMIAALLLVILLALWIPRRIQAPGEEPTESPAVLTASSPAKLAVLPFKILGDNSQISQELVQGVSEGTYERLTQVSSLRVVSPEAAAAYEVSGLDEKRLRADLGVDAALSGTMERRADASGIVTKLVDCRTGRQVDTGEFNLMPGIPVSQVSAEIARFTLKALGVVVRPEEETHLGRLPTADPEADRLYRKGKYLHSLYSQKSTEQAIQSYREAVGRDPRYAEAYAGMAEAWFTMAAFGWIPPQQAYREAEAAAKEALKINPRVSDAHRMLANLYSMQEGRLDLAEEHYRQAIEYDPSNVMALSWLAMEYAYQGRFKEALTEIGKARDLDPFSPLVVFYYGGIKYLSGDFVEGGIWAEKAIVDLKSQLALAYLLAGANHLARNRVPEARQALEAGLRLPNSPTWALAAARMEGLLAICDLRENRHDVFRQSLAAMQSKYATDHMYAYPLAVVYAESGDTGRAIEWLSRAVEKRAFGWQEIRFDPFLARLRPAPGFQDLLKKLPIRPPDSLPVKQ